MFDIDCKLLIVSDSPDLWRGRGRLVSGHPELLAALHQLARVHALLDGGLDGGGGDLAELGLQSLAEGGPRGSPGRVLILDHSDDLVQNRGGHFVIMSDF